jgi:opacity protein-like surface antigen
MEEQNSQPRSSTISGFNANFDFSYFFGKNTLKFGFELLGGSTEYNTYSLYGGTPITGGPENTTEMGIYAKYKASLGKLLLEPSFRLQLYGTSAISPEPRLAIKYNVNDWLRLKAAGGRYSQNLVAITSDRDVVNLFYGILSDIERSALPRTYNGNEIKSSLQTAYHVIGGVEFDVTDNMTVNVEGYWKDFTQLTNINRNKLYTDTPENSDIPDLLKKDFTMETGDAYGADISLKYEDKHWYIWAVYALGFVTREYEKVVESQTILTQYPPHFDRRHNINLILTYTAGAKREWEFSGRWNYGSGFPFTQIQGYYEYFSFQNGINFDYTSTNGEIGVLYGDLNAGRLPTYHRLDIDVKRKFYFSENVNLEVDLSVTNVYNRKNIFYVNVITSENVYQLPVMPTLGFTFSF